MSVHIKYFLSSAFVVLVFSIVGHSQQVCSKNSDSLYNRQEVLQQFESVLLEAFSYNRNSDYAQMFIKTFFVQDLSDVTNNYRIEKTNCINFINNHIYYFAPHRYEFSSAHIAILEDGKIKVFKNINCYESKHSLIDVLNYLENKLKNDKDKDEILNRVSNYRQYGSYAIFDYPVQYCKSEKRTFDSSYKFNPENLFKGGTKTDFSNLLNNSISEFKEGFKPSFFIERGKAVGFFIYDLTDPKNKQISLIEDAYLIKNHVYHFAPIDLPYSFSFIAVLGENEMKIFKAINCEGKGDSLKDVIKYLNEKLKSDRNKDEIIERVKNYRKYGVYTSFNGISNPQCDKLELSKNKDN